MSRAHIVSQGAICCFPHGLTDSAGELVNAEISAVVYVGGRLILASDKPIPGAHRSAVFALPYTPEGPDESKAEYFTADVIRQATKYEDFALTVDERYILATTGFDRIHHATSEMNHYNNLLVWPVDQPERARVAESGGHEQGSIGLRARLNAVLGTPYYKIEGLAAIPAEQGDGLLLFGVREAGQTYADFNYVCDVVGAHYRIDEHGELTFLDEFRHYYSFDPGAFPAVRYECGLSSLEYDAYNQQLYLLTSFESDEVIGGYLWVVSLDDFAAGRAPSLIEDEQGGALEFEHKAEGLAVLDARQLFVVYDNDREMRLGKILERDERYANEALYTVLTFEE
ncbi:hypothetical protein [Phytohalomonas tamaricis]|uniref:hypothetical protein n=1 Tax=Phytohalomonas tamaricis TaxID=2081032 RepID=UPI000D0B6B72|nr:hypothetical protein [Phytohalomonas tamaricis]